MDIVPERKLIQQEETRSQASCSESMFSRVGAGINFINLRHVYQHDWNLSGQYNIVPAPNLFLDGPITYPFNFRILDVMAFVGDANGSSGLTEFDIKWSPENAGAWQSIFTTTPKFDSTAAARSSCRIGQTVSGWTAPVLDKTDFDAYDILSLDLLQVVGGQPNSCFVKIWILPI